MTIPTFKRILAAVLLGAGLSAAPGGAMAADAVRVGSKIDTEARLLGNIILQVLDANGIATENKLQLGTTKIVRSALLAGEIDVYPEYTGNGAFFFNVDTDPAWKTAAAGYDKVKQLDEAQNQIIWLTPAPANNTWALAVRQEVADANQLATLEDFARWANGGGDIKLAASAEFVESPAALPSFQSTYGFELKQDQIITLASGDTAATIRAAAEQISGVNTAMVYGTDGAISSVGLVVLEDSKGAQIVYEPAATIRADALAKNPKIKDALAPVFASLDLETLQELNGRIAVDGEDPQVVAAEYLKSKGFVK